MKYTLIASLLAFSTTASAFTWDGVSTGKIGQIDVAHSDNFDLRIKLINSPTLCGNSNTWAYINESDKNYKGFMSAILAAKAMQSTVTVYTTKAVAGYCKIGYFVIN